jgi:hypothetical protein
MLSTEKRMKRWRSLILTACLAAVPTISHAAAPFDGSWTVLQKCPDQNNSGESLLMYDARVRHNHLSAFRSAIGPGDVALSVRGHIDRYGSALLKESVTSYDAEPFFNRDRGRIDQQYIRANFGPAKGEGHEIRGRRCDLSFLRIRRG